MKIRIWFLCLSCACACFADDAALEGLFGVPPSEEIDMLFKTGSCARVYRPGVYHLLTNLECNAWKYPSQEVDRVRHCLMTNVVTKRHEISYGWRCGSEEIRRMFSWVSGFPFVTNDIDAVNYLADYVGTVQSKKPDFQKLLQDARAARAEDIRLGNPTNLAITDPMLCFHHVIRGGPLFKEVCDNYRLAQHDERYFKDFRRRLFLDYFPHAVRGFMSHLPESERPAFRSNIVERARLTTEEQVKVFGK